ALALLVSACGEDDGDEGTGPGSSTRMFQATVSGDLSASLSGSAFFSDDVVASNGTLGWVLTLSHGEESGMSLTFARLAARPPEGAYTLADASATEEPPAGTVLAIFIYRRGQDEGAFFSMGGELRVTQSSADRMRGTFQVPAAGTLLEGGGVRHANVVVSGSFDAAR